MKMNPIMHFAATIKSAEPVIPVFDLKGQYQRLRGEMLMALEEVAESTHYVLGPKVKAFEDAFALYSGANHCVGVNSGTSALHLALLCAGVRPGDEVITVPMTFIATSWAVSYVGATPVYVDVDPTTYTMDVRQVEKRITSRTKALLPVHLYGQMADMTPLLELGDKYGIPVIEDAAQAHGATYGPARAGTMGLCGCFSFYPGKNLGAYGEAGAVTTNDAAIAARLRALRDHAQGERYHHDEIGFNYRMDGFQGAVLEIKLRYLEQWTQARWALAAQYGELLADLPLRLPYEACGRRHAWHLYVVMHPDRDRLRDALAARGIQTGLHYPIPLHLQKAYRHLGYREGDFPISEKISHECLTLPLFPEMTPREQKRVASAVRSCIGGNPDE